MNYYEKTYLQTRGPNEALPHQEVNRFLVGNTSVAHFVGKRSSYGHDICHLYPAWVGGERGWLLERAWSAAYGYCATGTEETLLSFREGVEIMISEGIFSFEPSLKEAEVD